MLSKSNFISSLNKSHFIQELGKLRLKLSGRCAIIK